MRCERCGWSEANHTHRLAASLTCGEYVPGKRETELRRQAAELVTRINRARKARGEPTLTGAEATAVARNLMLRAAEPHRYTNVCWRCRAVVDEGTNERCAYCRWLACWCGACRKPDHVDALGNVAAPCPGRA
jgi:hypothetical protein